LTFRFACELERARRAALPIAKTTRDFARRQ
jgi:hypothetical protein